MTSKEKYIIDYISGNKIIATKEEIDAVQPISRELVEIYGYERSKIQTRPQFRIRKSPSDEAETYPVDIVVFENDDKLNKNIRIIIECKQSAVNSGRIQLEKYMGLCEAKIGIWFNGEEKIIIKKIINKNTITYKELSYIPNAEDDIENDTLKFKKDLTVNINLKKILNQIRLHLTTKEEGITHDAKFAEEMINIILCKIYDERETDLDKSLSFYTNINDKEEDVKIRIEGLFSKVKKKYKDIFEENEKLNLSARSICYIVGLLQNYSIIQASRDVIGDAFEIFIGPSLRGEKGQYFTPRDVTDLIVQMLDIDYDKRILDPACGSGGFLTTALDFVWKKIDKQKEKKGWNDATLESKKIDVASNCFFGLDNDKFLIKITKAYMTIMGDGKAGIFCQDTLKENIQYNQKIKDRFQNDFKFDYIVANPPYGKDIIIKDEKILELYDLGHKYDSNGEKTKEKKNTKPQILFIEKIINFLKIEGRAGIILPEVLFSNKTDNYIIKYIMNIVRVEAVISLPAETFKPSGTDVKTCILIIKKEKEIPKDYNIFMSVCRNIGHDMRCNSTDTNDIPSIINRYNNYKEKNSIETENELSFLIKKSEIEDFKITPHTYWYKRNLKIHNNNISIQKLIDENVIDFKAGFSSVKAKDYTSSGVPFVRTSDISNFEIANQTSKYISENDYLKVKNKYDIKHKDILFVTRGRTSTEKSNGLIGEVALIMEHQTKIAFQGAILRIRVKSLDNIYNIKPENLIYLLSENYVKEQIKVICGTENALTGTGVDGFCKIKLSLYDKYKMGLIQASMLKIFQLKKEINIEQIFINNL